MFSWLRKSPWPPSPARENPGRGHTVLVTLENPQKAWEESCDLATSLAATLNALGHEAQSKGSWVQLGGFSLMPRVVNVEPMDSTGVMTSSTIQIAHASLAPGGLFEFQRASGTDVSDSFSNGFKSWAEIDLPVFLDALRASPAVCMVMTPGQEFRRIILGPPLQMAQNPEAIRGDHEFCPCCLFTNSIGAFEGLVRESHFYGIRLFVSRDTEGIIEAECRVNGVDLPTGAAALANYAKTWPDRGFEYRKQYVCIQTRAQKGG